MENDMEGSFKFKGKDIIFDKSWNNFFKNMESVLKEIEDKISTPFTPSPEDIFKIFRKPLDSIKYVVLGQDPYPQKGVATGRAFEVNTPKWSDENINRSLQNILKSIYYFIHNKQTPVNLSISEIRKDCNDILPPNELFSCLEDNGVFLLNLSLTCEEGNRGQSNSHQELWKKFSNELLTELIKNNNISWLIWGKYARKRISDINKKILCKEIPHPASSKLEDFIKDSGLNELKEFCIKK